MEHRSAGAAVADNPVLSAGGDAGVGRLERRVAVGPERWRDPRPDEPELLRDVAAGAAEDGQRLQVAGQRARTLGHAEES